MNDSRISHLAGGHTLVLDGPSATHPVEQAVDGVEPGGGAEAGHRLEGQDCVELHDRQGKLVVRIEASAEGAVVSLGSGPLILRFEGDLAIEAEHVSIRGERGLELSTGGEARIDAAGDLETEARLQSIHARLGDVEIRANDDVRLNGARIKLNC